VSFVVDGFSRAIVELIHYRVLERVLFLGDPSAENAEKNRRVHGETRRSNLGHSRVPGCLADSANLRFHIWAPV